MYTHVLYNVVLTGYCFEFIYRCVLKDIISSRQGFTLHVHIYVFYNLYYMCVFYNLYYNSQIISQGWDGRESLNGGRGCKLKLLYIIFTLDLLESLKYKKSKKKCPLVWRSVGWGRGWGPPLASDTVSNYKFL